MSSSDHAQSNDSNVISSNEYFRSIGQQADQVAPATNGATQQSDGDDVKPVEEIESLCMNCHDNVSRLFSRAGRSKTDWD